MSLKYLYVLTFKFIGSTTVANDDAMLVSLQSTDSPSLCNRTLDSSLESTSLAVTVAENHYFSGSHHGTNTYCEGCSRIPCFISQSKKRELAMRVSVSK